MIAASSPGQYHTKWEFEGEFLPSKVSILMQTTRWVLSGVLSGTGSVWLWER